MPISNYPNIATVGEDTGTDSIAMGDSWFSYVFLGGSLINHINNFLSTKGHSCKTVAYMGAEIGYFVSGKYKTLANQLLKFWAPSAQALFLSGGGNEFAGMSDMRPLLKPDCSGETTSAGCFRDGGVDDEGTLNWLMAQTFENYAILIHRALNRMPPDVKVFLHTYDYAIPTGKPAIPGTEAWLKPAFDDAQIPLPLQQGCVNLLIDRCADNMDALRKSLPNRIVVVDTRNILSPGDWANELHPKPAGFAKLVQCARNSGT